MEGQKMNRLKQSLFQGLRKSILESEKTSDQTSPPPGGVPGSAENFKSRLGAAFRSKFTSQRNSLSS